MFDILSKPWPQWSSRKPPSYHKSKRVPHQRRIPPPLARLVPDKCMLCLHLEELRGAAINSTYSMRICSTYRTSDVGVFQRLEDIISPITVNNMRVLFAKDRLQPLCHHLTSNSALSDPLNAPALNFPKESSPRFSKHTVALTRCLSVSLRTRRVSRAGHLIVRRAWMDIPKTLRDTSLASKEARTTY